jgi:hypothetical protein
MEFASVPLVPSFFGASIILWCVIGWVYRNGSGLGLGLGLGLGCRDVCIVVG